MNRLMLDSAFVIDHLRGLPEAVDRWRRLWMEGDEPLVTDIVVCEVRTGLHPADAQHLRRLLEPVEYVHLAPEGALLAGRWRAEARAAGRALSLGDSIIGAAAHDSGAVVLTRNVRDFSLMPVRVEAY
jgi:predicted nucleic acid-binding protein